MSVGSRRCAIKTSSCYHYWLLHFFAAADEEWKGWNRLGDPVMHIDLRDWADVAVLAPLSAHTLGKLANGLCDDTLSCVLRAWDFGHGKRPGKPVVLAPAMNTAMWEHPLTQSQLTTLQSFWNIEQYPKNEVHVVVSTNKDVGMWRSGHWCAGRRGRDFARSRGVLL